MKKIPYTYYKNIVQTLGIKKVARYSGRFNAKKFITRVLPYRMKQISIKQPLLFRKISMYTPIYKPSLMVKKLIKIEQERYNILKTKYIPKNSFKFLLQTQRFRKFDKKLNYFLFNEPKFSGIIELIPENLLANKTIEQQNEIILKFIDDYDEEKRSKRAMGDYSADSHDIATIVISKFEAEYYDENSIDDDDYFIED